MAKNPAANNPCPVSFNDLKTLKSFVGINKDASSFIIPVLYSHRCNIFAFFKSLMMSDGVHSNTLVSIVFGVETNKRVINRLKFVLRGSGIDVDQCVKHIILKTDNYPSVLRRTYIHTLFTIRYLYKYKIQSSHDVGAGITFENIEKWADTVFATEDDSDTMHSKARFVDDQIPYDIEIGSDENESTGVEEDGEKW